ncbi:hypothetical protein K438DRAFT_1901577 [Mycena galopus ATCC 62051]|nr:hypothetical protein K438DRAFT_1901577 [Mycena galopus ATCC 62051]
MSFDRIQKGSLVLVTGATGFVGSAVCDTAIARGFRVRGVTRSVSKAARFAKYLEEKHGKGAFELVEVKDSTVSGAYDEVLEDVAGILHIATGTSMSPSYDSIVGGVVQSIVGLMKAAAKFHSIKAFVLTSSTIAAFTPNYEHPNIHPKLDQWADHFVTAAKQTPDHHPMKAFSSVRFFFSPYLTLIRGLIQTPTRRREQGTRRARRLGIYNSTRPSYAFNAILPDLTLGPVFNPTSGNYSTHTLLNSLFLSERDPFILNAVKPASLAVDVRDVAALHLAALLSPQTDGKRIWAAAHRFEINDILKIWREAFPERVFVEDFEWPLQPKITLDLGESEKLLEEFEGRSWLSSGRALLLMFRTLFRALCKSLHLVCEFV